MNLKTRVKRQFSKAAETYDQAAFVQIIAIKRLQLMLPLLDLKTILDLGCGTGFGLKCIENHYKTAKIYGVDLAEPMLKKVKCFETCVADFDALPFPDQCVDLVFSNLALQWSPNLMISLQESSRVLKNHGLILFSTLMQGSLVELKKKHFLESQQIMDALHSSGFEIIEYCFETEIFHFNSFYEVLISLKRVGANISYDGIYPSLKALEAEYPQNYPLTYKFMFIHARKIK